MYVNLWVLKEERGYFKNTLNEIEGSLLVSNSLLLIKTIGKISWKFHSIIDYLYLGDAIPSLNMDPGIDGCNRLGSTMEETKTSNVI